MQHTKSERGKRYFLYRYKFNLFLFSMRFYIFLIFFYGNDFFNFNYNTSKGMYSSSHVKYAFILYIA